MKNIDPHIFFLTAIETARLTGTMCGEHDPKDYPVNEEAREAALWYCKHEGIKIPTENL